MGGEVLLGAGFDFGTSGVRTVVIDGDHTVRFGSSLHWESPDSPGEWLTALQVLLGDMPADLRRGLSSVCVSGTSASCLLVDSDDSSKVTRGPRMYNYNTLTQLPEVGAEALETLLAVAPPQHTTLGGTSALMKLACWHLEAPVRADERLAHQADYVAAHLRGAGAPLVSDWNNALKTGFDVEALEWPQWLLDSELGRDIRHALPQVVRPGAATGPVSRDMCDRFELPADCQVVAGTTDSIAAFVAAGVEGAGCAVTSLGSTLAAKMLSRSRVENASLGVYSHLLGGGAGRVAEAAATVAGDTGREESPLWLVGGASNVGCAVLRQEGFEVSELQALSAEIDPDESSALGKAYYPLPDGGAQGERFPVNDPGRRAVLSPRPDDRRAYLHAILEAIGRVEKEGYAALEALGATPLRSVATAGGGAENPTWMRMRQRLLGVPVYKAVNTDAAFGCALMAVQSAAAASPGSPAGGAPGAGGGGGGGGAGSGAAATWPS